MVLKRLVNGKQLRKLRTERLMLNQKRMAEELGVSRQATVSGWETGKKQIPMSVQMLIRERYAKQLG